MELGTAADDPRPAKPATTPTLKFLPLSIPTPASPIAADIRIELQGGAKTAVVTWPASAASERAAWMRELLR